MQVTVAKFSDGGAAGSSAVHVPTAPNQRRGVGKGTVKATVSEDLRHCFLRAQAFQNDADLVLGGMVFACGTANIAHQLFGWHQRGRGGRLLAHLHSRWCYDEPEILRSLTTPVCLKDADV